MSATRYDYVRASEVARGRFSDVTAGHAWSTPFIIGVMRTTRSVAKCRCTVTSTANIGLLLSRIELCSDVSPIASDCTEKHDHVTHQRCATQPQQLAARLMYDSSIQDSRGGRMCAFRHPRVLHTALLPQTGWLR